MEMETICNPLKICCCIMCALIGGCLYLILIYYVNKCV